jgi:glycine cleavage system H lipoate-binding protein
MALIGVAAADALSKLTGELEANAQVKTQSQLINADFDGHTQHADSGITHHYKATLTQTLEIDDSEQKTKLDSDDKKTEKTKNKKSGCFSSCFGRKG